MNLELLKLDPSKQMLVRQYTNDAAPNMFVAYLLLVLLGLVGGHHWYLAVKAPNGLRVWHIVGGVAYVLTFALGGLWLIVDLFLIPFYVKMSRESHEEEIIKQISGVVENPIDKVNSNVHINSTWDNVSK